MQLQQMEEPSGKAKKGRKQTTKAEPEDDDLINDNYDSGEEDYNRKFDIGPTEEFDRAEKKRKRDDKEKGKRRSVIVNIGNTRMGNIRRRRAANIRRSTDQRIMSMMLKWRSPIWSKNNTQLLMRIWCSLQRWMKMITQLRRPKIPTRLLGRRGD